MRSTTWVEPSPAITYRNWCDLAINRHRRRRADRRDPGGILELERRRSSGGANPMPPLPRIAAAGISISKISSLWLPPTKSVGKVIAASSSGRARRCRAVDQRQRDREDLGTRARGCRHVAVELRRALDRALGIGAGVDHLHDAVLVEHELAALQDALGVEADLGHQLARPGR